MKITHLFFLTVLFSPILSQADVLFADGSGIDGRNYFGINVASIDYDQTDPDAKFNDSALIFRIGHEFNHYLGLEGRLGASNRSVDYLLGVYARGNLFLFDPRARLYGLLGVTYGELSNDNSNVSLNNNETGLGYGVGIELYGNTRKPSVLN